jgi:AcrR family transcriptional regulator
MPKITDIQRLARRQSFIDGALDCMRTESFDRLTVDKICARANTSKGTFYLYFPSKKELLFALLDDQSAAFERLVSDLDKRALTGTRQLEEFVIAQLRQAQDRAQLQLRADLWGAASTDPEVRQRLRAATGRQRALLRGWVEHSIETGTLTLDHKLSNALASTLLALCDGLTLHRGIDPRAFRWKNIRVLLENLGR